MKKLRLFFILSILSMFVFVSCEDDDNKFVDVDYEYVLKQGTSPNVEVNIKYINIVGAWENGGTYSQTGMFKREFDAPKGFNYAAMEVAFTQLPQTATTPIVVEWSYEMELEEIQKGEYNVRKEFQTVDEYNSFCATPQVYSIQF